MKYIKTDREGLVKDAESGAVLNIDTDALLAYKKKKLAFDEVRKTNARMDVIENDISDIKGMLQELLKSQKNR